MAENLRSPIESYSVSGYRFGQRVRSRLVLWARHLGDDIATSPGTTVVSIAAGRVAWSEVRAGSPSKRNWGGLVVIGHSNKRDGQAFFSLYGHIGDIQCVTGDAVTEGFGIGTVATAGSAENGGWAISHLHFGIYVGPWTNSVLPGYARFFDRRTKFRWWANPREFIEMYNALDS